MEQFIFHMNEYIYTYIHIERERERERVKKTTNSVIFKAFVSIIWRYWDCELNTMLNLWHIV